MNANNFVLLITLFNFTVCQSLRYDNYSLFNLVPIEPDHLKFLQNLGNQKYLNSTFWKKPAKLFEDVQIVVNPKDKDNFIERTKHFNLKADLLNDNIQKAFDQQVIKRYYRLRTDTFTWNNYHLLEDIYQWLSDMALRNPDVVELEKIGKSFEGRDIFAVLIRRQYAKYKVIVEGGVHGNEWISIEFVTYLIDQLVNDNPDKNSKLNDLSYKYHWYMIPIVNPDGFMHSQQVDRMWRKNRRTLDKGIGVDLNRNFDYNFGAFDTSDNENDDNYCGPHPVSESETRAVSEFVSNHKKNLRFYFSFHNYGQKIIIPFADRIKHIENYMEMENYGKQAIQQMYKLTGVKYGIGTMYDTLGLRISGNSASWVKKTFNVRYVYSFLLRDNGTYGYGLPPEQILPTCEETVVGITEIMTAKRRRLSNYEMFSRTTKVDNNFFLSLYCIFFVFCYIFYRVL